MWPQQSKTICDKENVIEFLFFFNFAFKQHLVWFDLSKKNDYWFSTVIKFSFSFFFHPLSPILPPPPPASMLWSNEVKCVGRVSPGYTPTHTLSHTHTHTHTRAPRVSFLRIESLSGVLFFFLLIFPSKQFSFILIDKPTNKIEIKFFFSLSFQIVVLCVCVC